MHRGHVWLKPNRFAFVAHHHAVDALISHLGKLMVTLIQSAYADTTQSSATYRAGRDGMFRTHNELSQTKLDSPNTRVTQEKICDPIAQAYSMLRRIVGLPPRRILRAIRHRNRGFRRSRLPSCCVVGRVQAGGRKGTVRARIRLRIAWGRHRPVGECQQQNGDRNGGGATTSPSGIRTHFPASFFLPVL